MTTNTSALNIANLQFAYPDSPPVLTGLDLNLRDGERVGLIGPTGAGKTTLFMLICGVLKPVAGEVLLYDNPVKPGKFHPEVGLVFQYPNEQLFSPSVRDDIAFGPLNMGLSQDEVAERVNTAMQQTGIEALADRAPHHLSGGQKRMVAIAGIQAMQPKLVIYDEPGANLDMRSRRRLINYLQASSETVFVASHDLELVLEVCPRVVLLDDGRIIADGDAHEIMGDVALMEAHGLERPHSLMPHHTGEVVQAI